MIERMKSLLPLLLCPRTASSLTLPTFQGAGRPRPHLAPDEIPPLLMHALKLNDFPEVNAGLISMWDFAGDTTRESIHQTYECMNSSPSHVVVRSCVNQTLCTKTTLLSLSKTATRLQMHFLHPSMDQP